jgi:hypothetical protein
MRRKKTKMRRPSIWKNLPRLNARISKEKSKSRRRSNNNKWKTQMWLVNNNRQNNKTKSKLKPLTISHYSSRLRKRGTGNSIYLFQNPI